MMKMIVAIITEADAENTIEVLHQRQFQVTRIDSSGGFLREGNSTLIIGCPEKDIDSVMELIRNHSAPSVHPLKRSATILVLDVEHFEQIFS